MRIFERRNRAEEIQPMRIDATKIAAAQGDAMAIEEFEDLDRDLAPVLNAITKLRGRELPVRGLLAKSLNDADHLGDGVAKEEVIVRDLVELPEAAQELAEAADFVLAGTEQTGDVAHTRRAETLVPAQKRSDCPPQLLLMRAEAHLVLRQPHP